MKYQVEFIDLGKNKSNFSVESENEPDYDFLYKHARKHLMSSEIDFAIKTETEAVIEGAVIVGGFRNVGQFAIRNTNKNAHTAM